MKMKKTGAWSMIEFSKEGEGLEALLDLLASEDLPTKVSPKGTVTLHSVEAIGYGFGNEQLRIRGKLCIVVEPSANAVV